MSAEGEDLVPIFIPALATLLLRAEDLKGEPLTRDEVIRIRDKSPCIMANSADALKLKESRGGDIDPENCWHDWQMLRRELGREPDLDPGPKFAQIPGADPEYQKTIEAAHASLGQFRAMLPRDGSPREEAMVKTEITHGEDRAFMWLCNTRRLGSAFVAEFFEVPPGFSSYQEGDPLEVAEQSLLDWMVNDHGVLYGGFSLRYQRSRLPEAERASFDEYIGVTKYA